LANPRRAAVILIIYIPVSPSRLKMICFDAKFDVAAMA